MTAPDGKPARGGATPPRGPLGDARPDADTGQPGTRAAQPAEPVERRPGVGTVKPDDYPLAEREQGAVTGA